MNIAFVPIRCGSKSILHKNIKLLSNKPLVYWVLKALEDSYSIDQVFVALDCDEFANVVNAFGFKKVKIYWRSAENAQDTSSTESVMLEFLEQTNQLSDDDNFILVQATSPLITSDDFDKAFSVMKEKQADSLLTAVRVKSFFWTDNGVPINYDYQKRPRRQDFYGWLQENGAFYINRVGNIKKDKNRLSGKIAIYEMPEYTSYEIDELHDWIIIEQLMKAYNLDK